MNGVSLFSGVGGLELALHQEVKTIAYCEQDSYAQAVLIKRMQTGGLDFAPIFDDVRTFPGKRFCGHVDIVFGGFPCQDISTAGKGEGIKENTRSGLWFEMLRIIGEVQPQFVFLENVSAITRRGIDTVCGGLAEAGYNCRWTVVRASDVGAPHKRERWFCLAYSEFEFETCLSRSQLKKRTKFSKTSNWSQDPAEYSTSSESFVGRVADGIPQRVDRLKCLGNAVVPQQGRKAWEILTNKNIK